MHDHAPILDDRVHRHLAEKIRPAETTTVCHLNVEWAPVTDTVEGLNSRPGVVGQAVADLLAHRPDRPQGRARVGLPGRRRQRVPRRPARGPGADRACGCTSAVAAGSR